LILFYGVNLKAAKSVKFFVLVPPEQVLENVEKIAVLDFLDAGSYYRSDDGQKASDYIVASLLEKDRGIHFVTKDSLGGFLLGKGSEGKTYQKGFTTDFYSVAERSRIKKVLEEQNFSLSGNVSEEQAAELGKILGVDVVISGTVEVTSGQKIYYDKIFKKYYKKNEAAATLSMRMVGVNSGRIIGQKMATRMVSELADQIPINIVRDAALKAAANELVFYFAPSFRLEKIKLQVLKSKQHKSASKKAIKFLERGEFAKSLAIYTAIVNEDPYNHKAVFMQGVLYELACNYDKALEKYNMAYQIFDDTDVYHKAIIRVKGQKDMWKVLNKNNIHMTVMDLGVSKGQIANAGIHRVKLKGNSKIRIPVYASPGQGDVLMKVPGGISLDLISTENGFYKVKLFTGKQGYIHMKDAN
jgi:tetratricopeptide (TPR) repeat protein